MLQLLIKLISNKMHQAFGNNFLLASLREIYFTFMVGVQKKLWKWPVDWSFSEHFIQYLKKKTVK